MTDTKRPIAVHLPADLIAALQAQAEASGLTVEGLAVSLLEAAIHTLLSEDEE